MARRVVITGLGTVNPLGNNVESFWSNIKSLKSGITRITRFDPTEFTSQIAGEVKDFSPDGYIERKEARRMDRFAIYALVSALQAAQDAGITVGSIADTSVDSKRMGVVIGNGIGGVELLLENHRKLLERGPKAVYPLLAAVMIPNFAGGVIAIKLNAQGPCHTIVTACSSATDALGAAFRWIRAGEADIMVAGGTEAALTPLGLGSFCAIKALSTGYNDEPARASRPFDLNRDGFVMSEGAGLLVLEELEHATSRGARIYTELAGYGATCDASHMTAPHPEGVGAAMAMEKAIEDAGMRPEEIDYINA
ncbi:MAG TPA: beta-ketoacyl-ACP synthase II, partial [Spirochaetia bacterium]|nr:beta-ketoacyl-ACP synthase II [Spirochaetia bacterium]